MCILIFGKPLHFSFYTLDVVRAVATRFHVFLHKYCLIVINSFDHLQFYHKGLEYKQKEI